MKLSLTISGSALADKQGSEHTSRKFRPNQTKH